MQRILKRVFGVGLVIVGILAVGVSSALAASSSQSTTLNLTVPTSISLTGLAASYSSAAPAGVTTNLDTGPVTVITNNTTGYTLKVAAGAANFVGVNPANVIPIGDDMVSTCDGTFSSCAGGPPALTTTGTTVKTTSGPTSGDVIGIRHGIAVPGSSAADTYSLSVTYTATANP